MFEGRRLSRWHLMLEEFSFVFKHIDGVKNGLADLLSRQDCISGKEGLSQVRSDGVCCLEDDTVLGETEDRIGEPQP